MHSDMPPAMSGSLAPSDSQVCINHSAQKKNGTLVTFMSASKGGKLLLLACANESEGVVRTRRAVQCDSPVLSEYPAMNASPALSDPAAIPHLRLPRIERLSRTER